MTLLFGGHGGGGGGPGKHGGGGGGPGGGGGGGSGGPTDAATVATEMTLTPDAAVRIAAAATAGATEMTLAGGSL